MSLIEHLKSKRILRLEVEAFKQLVEAKEAEVSYWKGRALRAEARQRAEARS